MITLINTNGIVPPIAPIGLDYLVGSLERAGIDWRLIDLNLADAAESSLRDHFNTHSPRLVGLSFRNVDDSFWPSARSFLPNLMLYVRSLRELTDAPIVLGGVGFSIFAQTIVQLTGADFGIRGDGEQAITQLYQRLAANQSLENIPGLVTARHAQPIGAGWRDDRLSLPASRHAVNNAAYLHRGGQVGLETKRGCPHACSFSADPLAKGNTSRCRPPDEVADEVAALIEQGVDMLHLCDSEFNIPIDHARAVCGALIDRGLNNRVQWYTYVSATPFDAELAQVMRRAGCVGINFTAPAASAAMLQSYRQKHTPDDLLRSIAAAKQAGLTVMVDLMFGGPGETEQTVCQAIERIKTTDADCIGAGIGVRLYPGLPLTHRIERTEGLNHNPSVHYSCDGPVDLLWPTYYVSHRLGDRPAELVNQIIGCDDRFFRPTDDDNAAAPAGADGKGYNYNDNDPLVHAIANGARGAYWDILRQMR